MKKYLVGSSQTPFPFGTDVRPEDKSAASLPSGTRSPLPTGWKRLTTGLRGSRLYHVVQPEGGGEYWEGEMPLDNGRVCRRFASELQARAWLHLAAAPRFTVPSFDMDEVHESLRVSARQT
jgi:hypothetical protein